MDSSPICNSDSTFCSVYEGSKKSSKIKLKKINKVNTSQFLDKVHNEVLLHLEGKVLIGKIQVLQYMKKISKMRLTSARNQYFAEKIQSSLTKIYNLTKQFEKNLSFSQISLLLDPLENCSLTEDLNMLEKHTDDPKHILMGSTSINCENSSFPIELLTNNNFLSLTPLKSNSSAGNNLVNSENHMCKNEFVKKIYDNKFKGDSLDLFSSENTEVYIERYSGNSYEDSLPGKSFANKHGTIFNPDEVVHSTKQYILTLPTTDEEICIDGTRKTESHNFVDEYQNNENKYLSNNIISESISINKNTSSVRDAVCFTSVGHSIKYCDSANGDKNSNRRNPVTMTDDMMSKNELEISKSYSHNVPDEQITKVNYDGNEGLNKEFNEIVSKIISYGATCVGKSSNTNTEISETLCDQDQNGETNVNLVKKVNLKTIIVLGDFFEESYNKKINELCYGLGKELENKTWREIHNELEYEEKLSRNVNHTLNTLFEKLSLEEHEHNERQYKKKFDRQISFHNFSDEDEKKIDWDALYRKNEGKLESIAEEFRTYFTLDRIKTTTDASDDDGFDGLNWKKLLE